MNNKHPKVLLSAALLGILSLSVISNLQAKEVFATTNNNGNAVIEAEININPPVTTQANAEVIPVASVSSSPSLSELKSFDVDVFQEPFALHDHRYMRTEVNMYLRETLQESQTLQFQSPGEAQIHLTCRGIKCNYLNVSVTQGNDGPEVWRGYVTNYALGIPYYNLGNSKKTAKAIVEKIAKEYRKDLMRTASVPTLP